MLTYKANAMIVSANYDWAQKTLRTCEINLVRNKQMKRLIILVGGEEEIELNAKKI